MGKLKRGFDMIKILRSFKRATLYILSLLLMVIISLLLFSVLEKYNLLEDIIIRYISSSLLIIIGIIIIEFFGKKLK